MPKQTAPITETDAEKIRRLEQTVVNCEDEIRDLESRVDELEDAAGGTPDANAIVTLAADPRNWDGDRFIGKSTVAPLSIYEDLQSAARAVQRGAK